ncbi:MAG: hypothetical protein ACO20I_06835, partial [bacterium]
QSLTRKVRSEKAIGLFHSSTHPSKKMIEPAITAILAVVSGGFVLTGRINGNIKELERRIDQVELRVAQHYVSKNDFAAVLDRVELHMQRIEEKLDRLTTIARD